MCGQWFALGMDVQWWFGDVMFQSQSFHHVSYSQQAKANLSSQDAPASFPINSPGARFTKLYEVKMNPKCCLLTICFCFPWHTC